MRRLEQNLRSELKDLKRNTGVYLLTRTRNDGQTEYLGWGRKPTTDIGDAVMSEDVAFMDTMLAEVNQKGLAGGWEKRQITLTK